MRSFLCIACICVLFGCIGTEVGNPPVQPVIDSTSAMLVPANGGLQVVGFPGAVTPAQGSVRGVALATGELLTVVDIESDGSFLLDFPSVNQDTTVVWHAINEGVRSVALSESLADIVAEVTVCLTATNTTVDLLYGQSATVQITNACGTTEFATSWQLGGEGLTQSVPATLAEGINEITITASSPADFDVLRVTTDRGEVAIQVFAKAQ